MHLRQETIREDADVAIRTILQSFIETQKHGKARILQKELLRYTWLWCDSYIFMFICFIIKMVINGSVGNFALQLEAAEHYLLLDLHPALG
jgi:hypothetical protein